MKDKNIVIYIGNFSFPFGNASGKRVYANGKILKELGYEVVFIGMDINVSSSDILKDTRQEYDGFTYYNFSYPASSFDWLKYRSVFKKLVDFLSQEKLLDRIGLMIYYGSPSLSLFNTKLISYCKIHDIKIVADCVDWLTTKTNNIIFNLVKWADNTYQKAYANKRADGVIAISNFLAHYYKQYNCLTVVIPPLSPNIYTIEDKKNINNHNKLKVITYAGIPFRKGIQVENCKTLKDRIDKTIILLYQARQKGCNFIFNIFGFTKEEYLKAIPGQREYVEALGSSLVFNGSVPNESVINYITRSDFTILIRDVNRDTTAGFPTKFSESISCGIPVITTKTSDLNDYIKEGKNGFFLDPNDEQKGLTKLQEILNMDQNGVLLMKKYCRAHNAFYYKNFTRELNDFLITLTTVGNNKNRRSSIR